MDRMHWIVIPTYNERKNIETLIPLIFAHAPAVHVLVVDDASPDGTQEAVKSLAERYPQLELYAHNQKAGFAKAYIDAFRLLLDREPQLESLVMMDADLSHDASTLPSFFERLQDFELVIGSRYIPGGSVVGWEWWRNVLSRGGNVYLRSVSGLPIRDVTGGFNGIRASALRRIAVEDSMARGYAFQFLLKSLLLASDARYVELPIVFRNRVEGESKLTHHIITEALILPWRLKWNSRRPTAQ